MSTGKPPDPQEQVGQYANYLQVGHNLAEFVLEFGEHRSGEPEPRVHTRVVTSPFFAKAFLRLLETTLEEYEAEFGPLPEE